jgi:hypothetical protein
MSNELEFLAPSVITSIERAQIDSQVATAHAYPRSLEMFKKRAHNMATLDLQTAESCIYSRPVGGGKTAEGASIRFAEIVAACYGNLRVASRIIEQTPRYVKCEGVAHDLESNYAGKSECIEPTVKTDGTPYSESQRAVVAKACLAKAYRDAVFKVVPKALCKSIIEAARAVINKEVATIEQRRDRARQWLKQIKVSDDRVFAVLGVKGWSEVTDDQLLVLTGLKTAINEQDTTVEEAFPVAAKTPEVGGRTASTTTTTEQAKSAEKPPQAPPQPAEQKEAPKTPAAPETPAPAPAAAANTPNPEPTPSKTEPEPAPSVGSPAETGAPSPPASVPNANTNETEALQSLRLLMAKSGVTEEQIMGYCRANNIAKAANKKLGELSDAKLLTLAKGFHNILPKIRG